MIRTVIKAWKQCFIFAKLIDQPVPMIALTKKIRLSDGFFKKKLKAFSAEYIIPRYVVLEEKLPK